MLPQQLDEQLNRYRLPQTTAPKALTPLNSTNAPESSGAFLWRRLQYAVRRVGAAAMLVSLFSANSLQAQSLSGTEISTGAAAVAVLAQKCAPSAAEQYRQAARARLEQLSATLADPAERRFIVESFETKVRALSISSQHESCGQANKLRLFARQWGFAHFIE